ncbi:hypothetical protein GWK47_027231 [Chionoecetes opilio]|uniref:Ig-like domain-containing protein n=1 Tax=Chionoecetes opilio TaxID=41210 RepID=A0A8J8WDS9_CHIOP|nr:hypothetical protein GWK47_027231 [Chionoecetes opilio]
MKTWQYLLAGLATLAAASALTMGPVRLPNNNGYINITLGASPDNSLLECVYHLEGEEVATRVSWEHWDGGETKGRYDWYASLPNQASGALRSVVNMDREDGSLEFLDLNYDLSGEYSCSVTLSSGEEQVAARWEVPVVDSVSHLSLLHRSLSDCLYTSNYSTLAMYPEPVVRAGLYSEEMGGFYKEVLGSQWLVDTHTNGSVTYSYSGISFELNAETPVDISFYVMVGVMKRDGNYIPISSTLDKHIILHQLGCQEPRVAAYQHIDYHRDTITCRGEHRETEATVTCKKGYHADGDVEAVMISCNEVTRTWMLEDGQPAKREDLGCVIDGAPSTASVSTALLAAALVLQRFLLP